MAGVILQMPNYYGIVEDYTGFADDIHENKALMIMNSVAADLAVLKSPGEWGADIAVGDGQSLGIPMSFGGPSDGYMCCNEKLIRKMPGRIVGLTKDNRGQRAFVLTLQAREQHIRRQKATSNICSNESLMALYVTIYMSLMGKEGLKEAAELSYAGAHYLCDELLKTGRFTMAYDKPFFNEFCVRYDGDIDALQERCIAAGYLAGVKIDEHTLMLAVTEKRQKHEIDELVELMKLPKNEFGKYAVNELPEAMRRKEDAEMPECDELTVVRHYTNLSGNNFGVNNGFYPLGSCTMKYNPIINEEIAAMREYVALHPLQPAETCQGALEVYYGLQGMLSELTGMSEFTLNPFAGAHGELTGLMVIRAYHRSRGDEKRTKVIIPDSAHGTNPASAAVCGLEVVEVKKTSRRNSTIP